MNMITGSGGMGGAAGVGAGNGNGNGGKLEVLWSPVHAGHFVTWGADVSLYEVGPFDALDINADGPSRLRLSESTGAHLVATNGGRHFVKCADVRPRPDRGPLLALGLANGKVVLSAFGPTPSDALGLDGREFIPRHARQCNGVAWNPRDADLLAGALDKFRNDHCILLWDATRSPAGGDGGSSPRPAQHPSNLTPAVELARPVAEMGLSEHAHSLAWLHRQPRTLVVGMNQKQIKIFDLRDITNKAVSMAATKAVYGVCVDPHNDHQIASRVDNVITIWDRRAFDKPLLTLMQNKAVTKIAWCPTRHNLLGSLQRDSTVLHLADLRGLGSEDEISNGADGTGDPPAALERSVAPGSTHTITSFSWHPTDTNRLLTISMPGTITDYTVCERITLNWGSGSGQFVWSHGNATLKMLTDVSSNTLDDISIKIKRRAATDYGLKVELWQNGDMAEDEQLKRLWYWLYISRTLVEDGCIRNTSLKHPGVKSVLKIEASSTTLIPASYILSVRSDFSNLNTHNTTYKSEDRDKALQLCGWNFDRETSSLLTFLERLEVDKAYTRAAAIAVFNMKLRVAIEILNRGAEKSPQNTNLGIISMALSGYSEAPGNVWRQSCSTLRHLTDPYVRGIFAFLTSEYNAYDGVLNETGMCVEDRVAFACVFLTDSQLCEYINRLTCKLIDEGNLSGILLTGTHQDCLNLFQQYLDSTGDVQSVSLIAARSFQPELLKEPKVVEWIASYRNLLDSWHFWAQRALFDITVNMYNPSNKPTNQIYVSCNFCGKNISEYMLGLNRNRSSFARIAATSNKFKQMSACPNCRKPLPRCAICLLHMGAHGAPITAAPITTASSRETHKNGDFSSWFTWCQTCRHGGHAVHMTQWFKEHSECPVTSCTCRCFSIDSVSSHSFLQLAS